MGSDLEGSRFLCGGILVSVENRLLYPRRDGGRGGRRSSSQFVRDEQFLALTPLVLGASKINLSRSDRAVLAVKRKVRSDEQS